jgi:hypothetical protein
MRVKPVSVRRRVPRAKQRIREGQRSGMNCLRESLDGPVSKGSLAANGRELVVRRAARRNTLRRIGAGALAVLFVSGPLIAFLVAGSGARSPLLPRETAPVDPGSHSRVGEGSANMDDEDRKLWLISMVAAESRAYAEDQDGMAEIHFARGQAFLDAGYYLELLSKGETERLGEALLRKEMDDHVFLDLQD